ncbi:uroporphyrinogen-III C-methyltransferase [Alkalilimnicola ehrlichii]|uniref:uroporphyrinogen-III C-methyltransferase n=1 Tax=Alkalilimnicola ehrlichii TaxID=351052 RepID=A0A3E0X1P3_9GAMM|nr:uroporphyrinogen-III C-methyltransferase [Alkalilimnicola ehrlichii]RFA30773.1 uroporphyrinogen-III C-methyltransferase [Alkalilimnicola ehrlichii]RFA38349.1 uroporphyrinogen-III C-methyltransferase [Alkalilimnicola ehrlichii]
MKRRDALPALLWRLLQRGTTPPGRVYLIGAGPGDPELLTLGALSRLREADIVLYDRLVSQAILDLIHPDAQQVYVGKRCGRHSVPQTDIETLMIDYARQGKRVARLKGGDPFMFGRGGEEVETLAEAGIEVEVVPGITAATGCAAYAGIPLTHRDYAQSCLFVTAHRQEGAGIVDWQALTRARQTVVVYMGLGSLRQLCDGLIRHGLTPDWPVAVIEKGTTKDQRIVVGTLNDIACRVVDAELSSPALTVIGEVVRLYGTTHHRTPAETASSLAV